MGLEFNLRRMLADIIRFAVILLVIVIAILVGVALFAVGMPLLLLIALVVILSMLGHYIDPTPWKGFKFSFGAK